jgi:hypothetical protein
MFVLAISFSITTLSLSTPTSMSVLALSFSITTLSLSTLSLSIPTSMSVLAISFSITTLSLSTVSLSITTSMSVLAISFSITTLSLSTLSLSIPTSMSVLAISLSITTLSAPCDLFMSMLATSCCICDMSTSSNTHVPTGLWGGIRVCPGPLPSLVSPHPPSHLVRCSSILWMKRLPTSSDM